MPEPSPLRLLVPGVKLPAETFLRRQLEGLAASGIQVTLTTLTSRREFKWGPKGVRVIRLPHSDVFLLVRLVRFVQDFLLLAFSSPDRALRLFDALRALKGVSFHEKFAVLCHYVPLARLRADIVHFESINFAIDYLPLFSIWKCPVVVSCRGILISVRPRLPGNKTYVEELHNVFARAAAIHCVSADLARQEVLSEVDRTKIHVIRPAVSPERFLPSANPRDLDGVFRIVTVSGLWWVKGHEYALTAVGLLRDKGVRVQYHIVGDGPEKQRVIYTINDLHLQDAVCLYGSLSEEKVIERLQQSDAFLLSSHSEGISNSVLEAMACALPVVSTDCGGMREVITDGIEGFVVPNRDPVAMAKALEKLADDPVLRERLGAAGRQRILSEFSRDRQIDQWLSLYRQVATREGGVQ